MNERALTPCAGGALSPVNLLADFGAFLRLHVADGDASSHTIRSYHTNARQFVGWCKDRDIEPAQALPIDGVYATLAYIDSQIHESMTNIGKNPTFGSNQRTVEVHILDYEGNLYDQNLKIDIIERLRGERHFDTAEELKHQISEDIKQGRSILTSQVKV